MDLRDILRPGVTGTAKWKGGSVEPVTDEQFKHWLSRCHALARRYGDHRASLINVPGIRSYRQFKITPRTDPSFEVLLHRILPYCAFWTAEREAAPDDGYFLDIAWSTQTFGPQVTILPAQLLNEQFVIREWMRDVVDPGAWYDMNYWQPPRVGDLIFNWFD